MSTHIQMSFSGLVLSNIQYCVHLHQPHNAVHHPLLDSSLCVYKSLLNLSSIHQENQTDWHVIQSHQKCPEKEKNKYPSNPPLCCLLYLLGPSQYLHHSHQDCQSIHSRFLWVKSYLRLIISISVWVPASDHILFVSLGWNELSLHLSYSICWA